MISLEDIKSIIQRHRPVLAERFNVSEIAVFGSYARAQNNESSDIDILVEFSNPISLFKFIDLEEYLEAILGIKVDLVSKKALKPFIGRRILSEKISI